MITAIIMMINRIISPGPALVVRCFNSEAPPLINSKAKKIPAIKAMTPIIQPLELSLFFIFKTLNI